MPETGGGRLTNKMIRMNQRLSGRRVRHLAGLALFASAILAGFSLIGVVFGRATIAAADNMIAISGTNGGSGTAFNLTLPGSAACGLATNKSGGDLLDSYVVDASKTPLSQIGSLTFTSTGFNGDQLLGQDGSPYNLVATQPDNAQVPAPPPFSWSRYDQAADFGSGMDLYPGTFNVGIACVTPTGNIDNNEFWNVQIAFTAAPTGSDQFGFNWALVPFATSVALSASPNGGDTPGAAVTLTATVTPASAPGTVTFYDGSTALGPPVPVVANSGVASATFVTGSLPTGSHSLTAKYAPQVYNSTQLQAIDVYGPSQSTALPYVIAASGSATTTTIPSAETTTTTAGSASTPAGSGTGGTSSSGPSDTAANASGATGSGSGGPADPGSSGSGGSGGSGSSTLANTGQPISTELLIAGISIVAGLFVLSFAVPTVRRRNLQGVDSGRDSGSSQG